MTQATATIPATSAARHDRAGEPSGGARRSLSNPTTAFISNVEIAQLVSMALEDALTALGQPNPETCLRLRATEARAGIRNGFAALRDAGKGDEKLHKEYRRVMVLQNLTLDLALKLVDSISYYAKAYGQELPFTRTRRT